MNNLQHTSIAGFPRLSQFRTVRGLFGNDAEVFSAVPIYDSALTHPGILSGDILIVKITKHFNEANLYIWNTPHGRTAKFARENRAEITLRSGKE